MIPFYDLSKNESGMQNQPVGIYFPVYFTSNSCWLFEASACPHARHPARASFRLFAPFWTVSPFETCWKLRTVFQPSRGRSLHEARCECIKRGGINLRDRFTVGPDSWGIFSCSSFMCLAQLKQPRGILFKTSTTRYPINHKLLPGSAGVQEMETFRCGMGGRPLSTNKGNGIINVGRSANSPPRYLIASCDTHGVAPRGASSQSVRPNKIKVLFFFFFLGRNYLPACAATMDRAVFSSRGPVIAVAVPLPFSHPAPGAGEEN